MISSMTLAAKVSKVLLSKQRSFENFESYFESNPCTSDVGACTSPCTSNVGACTSPCTSNVGSFTSIVVSSPPFFQLSLINWTPHDPRAYGVGYSIIIVRPVSVESLPFADEESNGDDFVNDIGCKSFESFAFKAM